MFDVLVVLCIVLGLVALHRVRVYKAARAPRVDGHTVRRAGRERGFTIRSMKPGLPPSLALLLAVCAIRLDGMNKDGVGQLTGAANTWLQTQTFGSHVTFSTTRTSDIGGTTKYAREAFIAKNARRFLVDGYDAVGDGAANDASAIQSAIDAAHTAGGGVVDFTPGKTYGISSPLTLKYGVSLRGIGGTSHIFGEALGTERKACIKLLNSANCTMLTNDRVNAPLKAGTVDQLWQRSTIEGIEFYANANNQTATNIDGIHLDRCWSVTIKNCVVTIARRHALHLNDCNTIHVMDCHLRGDIDGAGAATANGSAIYGNSLADCIFQGVQAGSCYGPVLTLTGGSVSWKNTFTGCFFFNSYNAYGIHLDGSTRNTFTGCRIDQNYSHGIYVGASAQYNTFSGCTTLENGYNPARANASAAQQAGIYVVGTRNTFTGNVSVDNGYGIVIDANADYNQFKGNKVQGNVTGALSKNATGTANTLYISDELAHLPDGYTQYVTGLTVETTGNANGLKLQRPVNAIGSAVNFIYSMRNSASAFKSFAVAKGLILTDTDGAEDGQYQWNALKAGVDTTLLQLDKNGLDILASTPFRMGGTTVLDANRRFALGAEPDADNTRALGDPARNWSNLYLKRTANNILFMGANGLVTESTDFTWDNTNKTLALAGSGANRATLSRSVNANGSAINVGFVLQDSASAQVTYATFKAAILANTAGATDGQYAWNARVAGVDTALMQLDKNGLSLLAATPLVMGAGYIEMSEMSDPAAPAANKARFFTRDNGSGKTQTCIRYPTGAIQVIATEP